MTVNEFQSVQESLKNSVQIEPVPGQLGASFLQPLWRGPLLPAWGTRAREKSLRDLYHHDYNTLFRGAIAGMVKIIQSTPWEIIAPPSDAPRWQTMLMNADFGDWDRFLAKLIVDYSRHDQGGFIELIAPGPPTSAPTGAVVGLSILDSVRCYPTGNAEYPVIYYDLNNGMHLMHFGRVSQLVDSPDSSENQPGYGDCSLSRAVAPVNREILMGRYVEAFLDDKPPPGFMIFGNIAQETLQIALDENKRENLADDGGEWGRTARLFGMHAETKPTVDTVSYTDAPAKFDFDTYTNIDAKAIAAAIGLDINDFWELTSAGLGTGTQSVVMARKSRGKAIGRIYKAIERIINKALPENAEFKWQYKDPEEDQEEANKANTWASTIVTMGQDLSMQERRELYANQVGAFRDILLDESGQVRRLPDDDPKTAAIQEPDATPKGAGDAVVDDEDGTTKQAVKNFSETADLFESRFKNIILKNASSMRAGGVRSLLRNELQQAGLEAYKDGLKESGVNFDDLDATEKAEVRSQVGDWLAAQNEYIVSFAKEVKAVEEPTALDYRAPMWVSKSLRTIYFTAKATAAPNKLVTYVLGPAKKHCDTCLKLDGQTHKLKDFMASGFFPGSSELDCTGINCQCGFKDAPKGSKVSGNLPGQPARVTDRLLRFARNLLRGS